MNKRLLLAKGILGIHSFLGIAVQWLAAIVGAILLLPVVLFGILWIVIAESGKWAEDEVKKEGQS